MNFLNRALVATITRLIHCLTILLGAQVSSIWNESHTQRVYQLLLNYTVHPKPKVKLSCSYDARGINILILDFLQLRKVSQNGVVAMLKEGTMSGGFHPAARPTASHCLRILEGGNAETTVLHILGMLSDCLANMNPSVGVCMDLIVFCVTQYYFFSM